VDQREAQQLLADAVGDGGGVWADLGAGTGTFTRALRSLLAREARIYAVDSDPAAILALEKIGKGVIPVQADFSNVFELPETPLDGMLVANALHFIRDQEAVLGRLVNLLRPGGRLVLVEYDRRRASRWVPYPLDLERWLALAVTAGLEYPALTARRPSQYAGELYASVATRPAGTPATPP
jgi:trans-aconitate methyltransferase